MIYRINIAGSRSLENKLRDRSEEYLELLDKEISLLPLEGKEVDIISGGAKGPDEFGEFYAYERDYSCSIFLAKWDDIIGVKNIKYRFGKPYNPAAGVIRNKEMGDAQDALVLLWDGVSNGSNDMLEYSLKLKHPVILIKIDPESDKLYESISYENFKGKMEYEAIEQSCQ